MSTIVLRSVKGSGLTNNEIDANFTNLNTDKVEAAQTATLTNKTVALSSNTISGTLAQFNTALTDGDFATLAGTETLTNKTLTNPSYSGATANGGTVTTIDINGGTIDGTVIGGSSAAAGSFTTLSATGNVDIANGVGYRWGTGAVQIYSNGTYLRARTNSVDRLELTDTGLAVTEGILSGGANAPVSVVARGSNSGTAGGAGVYAQVGPTGSTSTIIAIGNKSNLVGGAYNATPYIWGSAPIETNVGLSITGALSASGGITSTYTGGSPQFNASSATTGISYGQISNTGAAMIWGVDSSAGGGFGTPSSAYDAVLRTATALTIGNATNQFARVSSTGLAVTGALSATGRMTSTDGVFTLGNAYFNVSGTTRGQILTDATNLDLDAKNATHVRLQVATTTVADVTSAGLAVTGALSATGNVTIGASGVAGNVINKSTDSYSLFSGGSSGVLGGAVVCFGESHATVPNQIQFRNSGNTTRMTLDASGNLGLGVTPSAWRTTERGLEVAGSGGSMGALTNTYNETRLYNNAYVNTTPACIYKTTGGASMYRQDTAGTHSWHSAASGTAGTTFTFTQSLAVGLGTTLALQGATSVTGCGISFPATQVASSDANTLDDYEEGTWTPTLGGTATYTIQEGYYRKVGQLVYVQCKLVVNVLGTGSTTTISGLPFTSINAAQASNGQGTVGYFASLATSVVSLSAGTANNGTTINFTGLTAAASTATSAIVVFGNSTRVDFSLTYIANA